MLQVFGAGAEYTLIGKIVISSELALALTPLSALVPLTTV